MLDSVQRLEECDADFGDIEGSLEALKARIATGEGASAVDECSAAIVQHERSIHRQFTHLNHQLDQLEWSPLLDVEPVKERLLDSIDELVRTHLSDSGYESVARLMQEENPEVLGLDFENAAALFERSSEMALYKISDGEMGKFSEVHDGDLAGLHHDIRLVDHFNAEGLPPNDSPIKQVVHTCRAAVESCPLFLPKPPWLDNKRIEYLFLKNLQKGSMAALQYLRSVTATNTSLDTQLVSRLSGMLASTDDKNIDVALFDFTIAVRAELHLVLRRKNTDHSSDLKRMIDISKEAMQANSVAFRCADLTDPNGELPSEVEISKNNWHHIVLVCPVEKTEIPHNDLRVLKCGHVLSAQAVRTLGLNRRSIQCPGCQRATNLDDITTCNLRTDPNWHFNSQFSFMKSRDP